jgi:hypothetical protein
MGTIFQPRHKELEFHLAQWSHWLKEVEIRVGQLDRLESVWQEIGEEEAVCRESYV